MIFLNGHIMQNCQKYPIYACIQYVLKVIFKKVHLGTLKFVGNIAQCIEQKLRDQNIFISQYVLVQEC